MSAYSVVDIFAGPGGLAEGFSAVPSPGGEPAFNIALSIEKEASAHSTLLFRAFLRQFEGRCPREYYAFMNGGGREPNWRDLYPVQWAAAEQEAWQLELGEEDPAIRLDRRLDCIREESGGRTVLIGGPPCQAYSLVGRARNRGKRDYVPGNDQRHFLYQEYIRILHRLKPAAFVMENVKGILSSSVDGESRIIDRVLGDLRGEGESGPAYRLVALARKGSGTEPLEARDFLVRAEDFGIPQARHRVIIVGLRDDIARSLPAGTLERPLLASSQPANVCHVLDGMPKLRSGLSRSKDGPMEWRDAAIHALATVSELDTGLPDDVQLKFVQNAARHLAAVTSANRVLGRTDEGSGIASDCPSELRDWLLDGKLTRLPNNETRGHMPSDLARYGFCALFAEATGRSPKAADFPDVLAPAHANWQSGKFADRFRVQRSDQPSTTVTSHISKDGHYFIHPDPEQVRSLTVREAARLQTFPDNYWFRGNRTQQYVQVGNAVPPYLARQIGAALHRLLVGATNTASADVGALCNVA